MVSDNNFYVTFPTTDTQTVTAGTSRIDFIRGRAILADGSIIPMSNRSTQINPLKSLYIYTDVDINIQLLFVDKTVYSGVILAGSTNITNTKYDLLIITTSANTEIFVAGSLDGDVSVN